MSIETVRALAEQRFPNAAIIEVACMEALLNRVASAEEHAQLLHELALAIQAGDPQRLPAAIKHAERASALAYQAGNIVLAVQARCHALTWEARRLTAPEFCQAVHEFCAAAKKWVPQHKDLSILQANQINGLLYGITVMAGRMAKDAGLLTA